MPRIKLILAEGDEKLFEPFDRNGHQPLCENSNTEELVEIFQAERTANLKKLRKLSLTESDFSRQGVHPAFGAVTLQQLIATWTVHDLNHIAQINKAMAFQYRDAVGPWQEFLSILSPPNPR